MKKEHSRKEQKLDNISFFVVTEIGIKDLMGATPNDTRDESSQMRTREYLSNFNNHMGSFRESWLIHVRYYHDFLFLFLFPPNTIISKRFSLIVGPQYIRVCLAWNEKK